MMKELSEIYDHKQMQIAWNNEELDNPCNQA